MNGGVGDCLESCSDASVKEEVRIEHVVRVISARGPCSGQTERCPSLPPGGRFTKVPGNRLTFLRNPIVQRRDQLTSADMPLHRVCIRWDESVRCRLPYLIRTTLSTCDRLICVSLPSGRA